MKRMKVLYLSQATGGVKRHIDLLVRGLDRERFDIVGIFPPIDRIRGSSPNKETFLQLFNRLRLRTIPLEMCRELHPVRDLASFIRLIGILKREQADILHTHSSKAGFLGRLAGRVARVPVVVHTPNAFAFDRPGCTWIMNALYKALERLAGVFCDALIAVSPSEEGLARQVIASDKIACIPNGIDLEEFDRPVDTSQKKKELGIPQESPFILSVGRLAPQKASFDFISAAERVLLKRPDVRFAFLGDGPLLEKTKALLHRRRLERRFFLFDWRSDAWEIMACCDLFVIPSLWEGLPYSILEAMALSKPVVATEARGNRDVVVDGETGILVPLRRPDRLAEAILRLLGDLPLARRMGQAGRRRVEMHFKLKTSLHETVRLYERLLAKKGGIR